MALALLKIGPTVLDDLLKEESLCSCYLSPDWTPDAMDLAERMRHRQEDLQRTQDKGKGPAARATVMVDERGLLYYRADFDHCADFVCEFASEVDISRLTCHRPVVPPEIEHLALVEEAIQAEDGGDAEEAAEDKDEEDEEEDDDEDGGDSEAETEVEVEAGVAVEAETRAEEVGAEAGEIGAKVGANVEVGGGAGDEASGGDAEGIASARSHAPPTISAARASSVPLTSARTSPYSPKPKAAKSSLKAGLSRRASSPLFGEMDD